MDGVYDFIASPPDHHLPLGAKEKRKYEEDYYRYKFTKQILFPEKALNPNKEILFEIIRQVNADKNHTLFIGDILVKDIKMAQEAGIIDVFAEYSVSQNENEYKLLRKVTHWKDEDVVKEKEAELED